MRKQLVNRFVSFSTYIEVNSRKLVKDTNGVSMNDIQLVHVHT